MKIVIIPGFTGYPEEKTFQDLEVQLTMLGHELIKIAWPHFPNDLENYSFTSTISHARHILESVGSEELIILGFSMGGIIGGLLATEFKPQKVGFVVSPYQAGSEDDLAGKYKDWQTSGIREITSSKFGVLKMPFSFIVDAQKYNALNYVSQITSPKLFIAGENDKNVPVKVVKKLYDTATEPKKWYQIDGMEHKYQYQPDKLKEVNEFIISFINSK